MITNASFFCPITFDPSISTKLTPKQVSNLKSLEWTSHYWTLSNKAYKVVDLKQLVSLKEIEEVCYLENIPTLIKSSRFAYLLTALHIVSFATLIIPFIVFIAHYINRSAYRLQLVDSSQSARDAILGLPAFMNVWEQPQDFRKKIYETTLHALKEEKYSYGLQSIPIQSDAMIQGTESYADVPNLDTIQLSRLPGTTTIFSVKRDDTVNVLAELSEDGKDPAGLNFANRYHPGGGVASGCQAQEEVICRRSDYIKSLMSQNYPLAETGGIYSPYVTVFRKDENNGYAFMEKSQRVALIAAAAYDLRPFSKDRRDLGLPLAVNFLSEKILRNNSKFMANTQEKIRSMLRKMALKGHQHLVLGAWGCGAFATPPQLIAAIFKSVFEEQEFAERFKTVDFAILSHNYDADDNVAAFEQMCLDLNSANDPTLSGSFPPDESLDDGSELLG